MLHPIRRNTFSKKDSLSRCLFYCLKKPQRQSETEEGISLKLPKEDNPLLLPLIEEETDEAEEEKVVVADETPRSAVEETEQDDSCFTETLAKIYIKQRRYDKALEIIKKLSLNYPKKNAYFADQIRFLEKLIINAKSK